MEKAMCKDADKFTKIFNRVIHILMILIGICVLLVLGFQLGMYWAYSRVANGQISTQFLENYLEK
jgi:hypothetical protein